MPDIRKQPYSEWLENSLREMVGFKPESIGIVVLLPGNHSATTYWETDNADRWAMIRSIAQDNLLDWVRINADKIQEILNGEEDEE